MKNTMITVCILLVQFLTAFFCFASGSASRSVPSSTVLIEKKSEEATASKVNAGKNKAYWLGVCVGEQLSQQGVSPAWVSGFKPSLLSPSLKLLLTEAKQTCQVKFKKGNETPVVNSDPVPSAFPAST